MPASRIVTSVAQPVACARKESIERYLQTLAGVPGWLDAIDFLVLQMIDEVQKHLDVEGNILEIGTYQGRTAILLGYLCRENESLTVCDVFEQSTGDPGDESEHAELYMDLTRESFERNFLRYFSTLPEIYQCRSQDLGPKLSGRSFRLVHVDGSHRHAAARSDLRLAKKLTASAGVVAIDDFRREHTPGVAAAAWEQVAVSGLVPICLTPGKMYGCWSDSEGYHDRLRELAEADPSLRTEEELIGESRVLRISDAAVVGLSREEWIAGRLAALQGEYQASLEAWRVEREAREQGFAATQAELSAVHAELAQSRAAVQEKVEALEAWGRRFDLVQQDLEERTIELAKQGLRNEDLRLHVGLLQAALSNTGR